MNNRVNYLKQLITELALVTETDGQFRIDYYYTNFSDFCVQTITNIEKQIFEYSGCEVLQFWQVHVSDKNYKIKVSKESEESEDSEYSSSIAFNGTGVIALEKIIETKLIL